MLVFPERASMKQVIQKDVECKGHPISLRHIRGETLRIKS